MDLRLVYLLAPIDGLSYATEVTSPYSIYSNSGGLVSTAEVRINRQSVIYSVISDRELSIDPPSNLVGNSVLTVSVFTSTIVMSSSQLLQFVVGDSPSYVSGFEQLVQQFVLQLYKEPGSDAFNKLDGAGLFSRVRSGDFSINKDLFAGEIHRLVRLAVKQLRRKQLGYRSRLKRGERLIDVIVEGVDYDEGMQSVKVRLVLITENGKAPFGFEL